MKASVVSQFRMKRAGKQLAVSGQDYTFGDPRQYFNLGACACNYRTSDKHSAKRLWAKLGEGQVGLETVNLATESITLDDQVHHAQAKLVAADDVFCHKYQPCAGTEKGKPLPHSLADRFDKAMTVEKFTDSSALAPWDHQASTFGQVFGIPDLYWLDSETHKLLAVFSNIALKIQNTDTFFHLEAAKTASAGPVARRLQLG